MAQIPVQVAEVLFVNMTKKTEDHPSIVGVRRIDQPVGQTLELMNVIIEHMPFILGTPYQLKKKDRRRKQQKGITTYAVPVLFEKRQGENFPTAARPEILFFLTKKHIDLDTQRRIDHLARAVAQRTMGEDMGLKWEDNKGFKHEQSGLKMLVGFMPVSMGH